MRQPQWDKYETALLIDTYWRVERGDLSRENGIAFLSQLLRKRAQTFGLEIDDTFRNTNGISLQLSIIMYVFTDGRKGIDSVSKLFEEMCELYLNDRKAFDEVLFAAKATNGNLSEKELFELWLQLKYNAPTATHYVRSITTIDQYCCDRKIIHSSLFGPNATANTEKAKQTIFNNKLFRIKFRTQIRIFEQAINSYCSFLEYCNKMQAEIANEYAIKAQQCAQGSEETILAETEVQNAGHTIAEDEETVSTEVNENALQTTEVYEFGEVEFNEIKPLAQSLDVQAEDFNKNLIIELDLSVRPFGVLKRNNIETVGELLQLSPAQLRSFKNMGTTSVEEIQNKLCAFLCTGHESDKDPIPSGDNATGMKPFDHIYFDEDQPLSVAFNVPVDEYEKVFITEFNLSVRPLGVLTRSNYQTVGELLQLSPAQLLALPNMGATSLKEIEKKLYDFLCVGDKQELNSEKHEKYSDSLKLAVRAYFNQETYDTSVLSEQEQSVYFQIIEHINDDNKEICKLALEQPESVVGIVSALKKFSYVYQRREKRFEQIISAMDAVDKERKAKPLLPFLAAHNCKEKKEISFSFFSLQDLVGSMAKILYHHRDELTGFELSEYLNVAQWLQTDDDTISKFFYHTVETTFAGHNNELRFFKLRTAEKTLEEIAQENGITRERVRQIESKASSRFFKLYAKFPYDLVMLASANFSGTSAVTFEQLETLSGEYTPLLWYCIKNQEKILKKTDQKISVLPYEYSESMNAILVDNQLSEVAQSMLSALPDIIIDSEIETLTSSQINDFDAQTVRHIIEQNFNHTGRFFARVPITVVFMCDFVLKNCYKNRGVKITDETQNAQFKAYLLEYFGSKAANITPRAIEAKVGDCGCLIDRGTYIHPDNLYIDITTLSKIQEFIDSSSEQRLLFNEIFENLYRVLGKAGITNRYMLHGVVKKYFSEYKTTRDFVLKGNDSENQRESDSAENSDSVDTQEMILNFSAPINLVFTKPVEVVFEGEKHKSTSWKDVYLFIVRKLYQFYPERIEQTIKISSFKPDYGVQVEFVDGKYVNVNLSANDLMKSAKRCLEACDHQFDSIIVKYIKNTSLSKKSTAKEFALIPENTGTVNRDAEIQKQSPLLYEKLLSISKIYDEPEGLSVDRIVALAKYIASKSRFIEVLDSISWATKVGDEIYSFAPVSTVPSEPAIEFDKENYIAAIASSAPYGMRLDSIGLENFKTAYQSLFHNSITVDDEELKNRLQLCGIMHNDILFLPNAMMDDATKAHLFEVIDEKFDSGVRNIYYQALFEETKSTVLSSCYLISDQLILKKFLKQVTSDNQYYFYPEFFSKEVNATVDYAEEILTCLLSAGMPMFFEDICKKLSHIPANIINDEIRKNPLIINDGNKKYFHQNIFDISPVEVDIFVELVETEIRESGFAVWKNVKQNAQKRIPVFFEKNSYIGDVGIKNCLKEKMGNTYAFAGKIISKVANKQGVGDLFASFAKSHEMFTAEELKAFGASIGYRNPYFAEVFAYAVRVDKEHYVSKERVQFSNLTQQIDAAISDYMTGEFQPLIAFDSFFAFPYVGFDWNVFLLESYVYSFSKQYKLVNNCFGENGVTGAVVSKSSGIYDFDSLCAEALAESMVDLDDSVQAMGFLRKNGYFIRSGYSNLESVLIKAKRIRQKGF